MEFCVVLSTQTITTAPFAAKSPLLNVRKSLKILYVLAQLGGIDGIDYRGLGSNGTIMERVP